MCFNIISYSQYNDYGNVSEWTTISKQKIYNDCIELLKHQSHIPEGIKQGICICHKNDVTGKYLKQDIEDMIEIEIQNLQKSSISYCAHNSGSEIFWSIKNISQNEPENTVSIANNQHIKKQINPNRSDLNGSWQDDNSRFDLNADGSFTIKFDTGVESYGKWWLDEQNRLITQAESRDNRGNIHYNKHIYSIDYFSPDFFRYKSIDNNEVYEATRVDRKVEPKLNSIKSETNTILGIWSYDKGVFKFYDNGDYRYESLGGNCNGRWKVEGNELSLFPTTLLCEKVRFEIISITESQLAIYRITPIPKKLFQLTKTK